MYLTDGAVTDREGSGLRFSLVIFGLPLSNSIPALQDQDLTSALTHGTKHHSSLLTFISCKTTQQIVT